MCGRTLLGVLAAGLLFVGPARAAAPVVETMVVGHSGVLLGASHVPSSATSVRVAGRVCAVASATPLAALLADARAARVALGLRDYGHCGRAAIDSGQLFVKSVGGQLNQGQDGWEYKVDHRAGSTGAADTGGAFGDGRRLTRSTRLLWFWCLTGARGCQRTLDFTLSVPAGHLKAGGAVTVRVSGYDNDGHGVAVGGAIVRLGSTSAPTGRGGSATLAVPRIPGRYALSVARAGMVPSFPETLVVR